MKLYFEAYGCTLNKGEAERVKEIVIENGHEIELEVQNAEIIIIFTCTVIETTERKMLKRIGEFSNIDKRIIVAGCMATIQQKKVQTIVPDAEFLSPQRLNEIIGIVGKEDILEKRIRIIKNDCIGIVPIANGCLGKCTYCITRLARGRLKSRSIQEITKEVYKAVEKNLKEIQITAQDTACYGKDIGTSLPDLMNSLTILDGDFRIRIGMMNPNIALPKIDKLIKSYSSEKVFKFLHLPLQSGDNEILKIMNRNYEVKDFDKIVNSFRNSFNGLTLSTDIIVGFPNENEESFQKSCEIIKRIKPDNINITRFSPRVGTKASKMKAPHSRIVKERSRILTKLRFEISKKINQNLIGNFEKILITETGKDNTMIGRTQNYKQVVINKNLKLGEFYNIKIISAKNTYLLGELA